MINDESVTAYKGGTIKSNSDLVKDGERLDDLQCGLMIIQNPHLYSFTSDAVFLADFVNDVKGKRIVDLGTGSGIIPLLISKKQPEKIFGIEIQSELADMAARSVIYNNVGIIDIINCDMLDAVKHLGYECADIVVCNPPYRKAGTGQIKSDPHIAICRHEVAVKLEQIIRVSASLLKNKGSLYMTHRTERMVELFCLMKESNIQPKELKFTTGKASAVFALRGVKDGKAGLKIIK